MILQQHDHDALHPVPSHRSLSCDVKFCSWLGQYIQALVTVNPAALEEEDELTGLDALPAGSCEERRLGLVVSSVAHVSAHGCR